MKKKQRVTSIVARVHWSQELWEKLGQFARVKTSVKEKHHKEYPDRNTNGMSRARGPTSEKIIGYKKGAFTEDSFIPGQDQF